MNEGRKLLDMNRYQWTVLFAAWLGWGFDVFDGLLFNYVSLTCVPVLLGIPLNSPEAKPQALYWTGILTSVLLIGWGIGGILFGRICDRIGRTRTLLLTMLLYSLGTAACAFAPNIWVLMLCRVIASLGIGGEWAAGASMVAEVVPERRRVEAGALLYTSAPLGLFLATFADYFIQHVAFPGSPETSWRYVFLCGLVPAAVAFVVRLFVKEPERWHAAADKGRAKIADLFSPEFRKTTLGGLGMAIVALLMWWSCNAFIPSISAQLAKEAKADAGVWKAIATNCFNLGGLVGTLLTIPLAKRLGRKPMFFLYFAGAAAAILTTFGMPMPEQSRLYWYLFVGLTVFGVFGSFTYFLPELYPTRLRATGAGFCYNAGRFVAAGGPFLIGSAAVKGNPMGALVWVAAVPVLGLLLLPMVRETKDLSLAD